MFSQDEGEALCEVVGTWVGFIDFDKARPPSPAPRNQGPKPGNPRGVARRE
jgi:hypothetical protein